MKIYLSVVLMLNCYLQVKAQDYGFGVKAGVNQYSIGDLYSRGGSIAVGQTDETFSPNKNLGSQYGVYFFVQYGKLFIRPEVNFITSQNNYKLPLKTSYWKTSKIDIPLLIGYQVFDPISIYAGPGYNIYNNTELDGVQVTSFSDGGPDLDKTTLNLNIGIMVSFGRFGADLRYEYGLKETKTELLDIIKSEYGTNLADLLVYRPTMIRLSVYIDVFRTNGDNLGNFFSNLLGSDKCYCPY